MLTTYTSGKLVIRRDSMLGSQTKGGLEAVIEEPELIVDVIQGLGLGNGI